MDYRFAHRTARFHSSAVRDILAVIQQADVISFAGGLPAEEFFPVEPLRSAYERVFAEGGKALQYGVTEGYVPLRLLLQERMKKKRIHCELDSIVLTTGSQQAIDLFSKVMLQPGDVVLTENPTYLAALQLFQSYEATIHSVQGDEHGMDPESLERQIQKYRPKFIYVVPTFSNPEGKVWSEERKEALLYLAQKYDVLVLEDDPYGELKFNEEAEYWPIASLDVQRTHVVYTSTFSKIAVPALRSGWVTGPRDVMRMMAKAKQAADLHSSSLDQQALYYLLNDFDLDDHIAYLRKQYNDRMIAMIDGLQQIEGLRFTKPKGGMFIWVQGDPAWDMTRWLHDAVNNGVAYVPGAPFYVNNPQNNTFRLNFTHSTPETIRLGIRRLTDVLRAES